MPWKQTDAMKERSKFVFEWEQRATQTQGRVDMSELCRVFGISRQTGYLWLKRYHQSGGDLRALEDRSRRPHVVPHAVSPQIEDLVVAARKTHPRWGPRTLRRWLVDRYPGQPIPSHSCVSNILKRRGLTIPRGTRKRRRGSVQVVSPFPECTARNQTWCIDFKGWFRTLDRTKCYPLTLLDAFSRFLLRCEALVEPNGIEVQRILDSAFTEYGLPQTMRSDGGPPFATTGPACLSSLMVWLLKLGLTIEIIAPGKPQQNGRLERFHRTLAREVDPRGSAREQQRAFDHFRAQYNYERPHHSLSLNTPSSVYERSKRRYPRKLVGSLAGGAPGHVERVDKHGFMRWRRRRIFVSHALAFEDVVLSPDMGTRWVVCFGTIELGSFDGDHPADRIHPARRPKGPLRLSLLAED
jgi:putative transposase